MPSPFLLHSRSMMKDRLFRRMSFSLQRIQETFAQGRAVFFIHVHYLFVKDCEDHVRSHVLVQSTSFKFVREVSSPVRCEHVGKFIMRIIFTVKLWIATVRKIYVLIKIIYIVHCCGGLREGDEI